LGEARARRRHVVDRIAQDVAHAAFPANRRDPAHPPTPAVLIRSLPGSPARPPFACMPRSPSRASARRVIPGATLADRRLPLHTRFTVARHRLAGPFPAPPWRASRSLLHAGTMVAGLPLAAPYPGPP